jgi:diadenosine tetraphosphatase ApaH/serine/threonine PP2A family protein phosphatase
MTIAIISDIHSNLEALTKAFDIIDSRSVDEIVCLGDIVGYGADPNECVDLVRRRCNTVIKGNHDDAVVDLTAAEDFTDNARSAILWTRKQITEENLDYLRSLSLVHQKKDMVFVHSSPCEPEEWNYIFDEDTAARAFRCFSEPLCFIGHTHMPMIFSPNGIVSAITRDERSLINVGSIGQPRDRNTDLSFGIFDTGTWTYENIRSPYDIETAAGKILKTSLPPKLGQRLFMGI